MSWMWGRVLLLVAGVTAWFSPSASALMTAKPVANDTSAFELQYPDLPRDAVIRRARSIAVMKAEGVPINDWLPVIESEGEAGKRAQKDIAHRAFATLAVALKGEGLKRDLFDKLILDYDLGNYFSPEERIFIADADPSAHDLAKFSWRYEAALVLLWSLGYIDNLDVPRKPCDPKVLVEILQHHKLPALVAGAKLRSLSEVLDQADLIYRYRWALVDARINNSPAPSKLNDDVAMERHHALNWLVDPVGEDWDNISLDT